ncbi:6,7-dimethyl-8-ribityllumazine synthase [Marinilabilia rubra]|uniref:6,7-dimethyl-8-ribityllumazine synthase n=1 Tax=Marinilabilia rubra TaxID=2162893 RepID=A0A2U2BCG6_9BACT|nr:6,7-dimethyl-8-ribityllumazine synthase [Marinilabilia rubra]PWE00723.1 6,7-dimethyl-8-ribityllumazine synthase [Marinilabilia rubra]
MATNLKNLSEYDASLVASAEKMKFGIVVSEWNPDVTEELMNGAYSTLEKHGAKAENILVAHVPGSFELTHGARQFIKHTDVDAIICLGCVIKGDTPHFDYVCQGVTQGITELNVKHKIPVIFGVLTTDNQQQALDRAGGKHGNKGDEGAITAIKMVALTQELKASKK